MRKIELSILRINMLKKKLIERKFYLLEVEVC